MAVSKNISKQAKPVIAKAKRPDPVKVAKITSIKSLPVKLATTVIDPIIEPVQISTEPILTEVVSPEPETTIQVNRTPKMRGVVVGLIGAGIGGYMAYTGIKDVLLDKGYNQDQANQYSLIAAGVIGLITFGVLYKLT